MNKTSLMIDARKNCILRIDGPALWIQVEHKSPILFPLRRISRIHVVGLVKQGFDALIHCAEQEIPVAFFNGHGKLRCQLYSPNVNDNILAHWLETIEFDPAAKEVYQHWLENQRLHLLSTMGYRRVNSEDRHHVIEQLLRAKANILLDKKQHTKEAITWLEGLLSSHLTETISRHSLGKPNGASHKLLKDLLPIFTIALLHAFVERLEQHNSIPSNSYGMSKFFHRYSEMADYHINRMLTQLEHSLENLI